MRAADARVEGIPTTVPRTPPAHALGTVTRGTTGVNRLRKCDRWMCHHPAIRSALRNAVCNTVPSVSADTCANTCTDACTDAATGAPLAIDLGYGAAPWTTVEMATRLRTHVCPTLEVVGLEIDPSRLFPPQNGVRFELGGFELSHYHPSLVRAFNVLRQYSEAEVGNAWRIMQSRLAPGGLIVEGTCNEVGQRAAWILLDNERPAASPSLGPLPPSPPRPMLPNDSPKHSFTATFPAKKSMTFCRPPTQPGTPPPDIPPSAPSTAGDALKTSCGKTAGPSIGSAVNCKTAFLPCRGKPSPPQTMFSAIKPAIGNGKGTDTSLNRAPWSFSEECGAPTVTLVMAHTVANEPAHLEQ